MTVDTVLEKHKITVDIEENLKRYLKARQPTARYTSFDYCFNYFQAVRETGHLPRMAEPSHVEMSCLHLGFYLASWGMLRGSTALLSKSIKHLVPVIEVIAATDPVLWDIDAHCITDQTIPLLLGLTEEIKGAFPESATDTLVTKILLGVFGSVPAFDTNFKRGFCATTFGKKALRRIADFYRENAETIERYRVPTIDFSTGAETKRKYTRAKVVDMVFFVEGGQ